jgi:hypothetical protein
VNEIRPCRPCRRRHEVGWLFALAERPPKPRRRPRAHARQYKHATTSPTNKFGTKSSPPAPPTASLFALPAGPGEEHRLNCKVWRRSSGAVVPSPGGSGRAQKSEPGPLGWPAGRMFGAKAIRRDKRSRLDLSTDARQVAGRPAQPFDERRRVASESGRAGKRVARVCRAGRPPTKGRTSDMRSINLGAGVAGRPASTSAGGLIRRRYHPAAGAPQM